MNQIQEVESWNLILGKKNHPLVPKDKTFTSQWIKNHIFSSHKKPQTIPKNTQNLESQKQSDYCQETPSRLAIWKEWEQLGIKKRRKRQKREQRPRPNGKKKKIQTKPQRKEVQGLRNLTFWGFPWRKAWKPRGPLGRHCCLDFLCLDCRNSWDWVRRLWK